MKQIAYYRNLAGLTQKQLAGQVGVSRRAIVRWETEGTQPRPRHLSRLAEALNCSTEDLSPSPETLAGVRRNAGLSQRDLAAKIGVPAGTIASAETGRTRIPNQSSWARTLGRTINEIQRLQTEAINHRHNELSRPSDGSPKKYQDPSSDL